MGEDIDVNLEKGKVLHIKTLTPGIEVRVGGGVVSYIVMEPWKPLTQLLYW